MDRVNRYPALGVANAFAKSAVIATGTKRASYITVYNSSASDLYFQIFDAAALPDPGTVPLDCQLVPSKRNASFAFGGQPCTFVAGIVAALSTTDTALTLTATNDGLFTGFYTT